MGLFMPGRRSQPRRFSYEPRYYNPERDESIKRRMRLQSAARSNRRKSGFLQLVVLLVLALYLYHLIA